MYINFQKNFEIILASLNSGQRQAGYRNFKAQSESYKDKQESFRQKLASFSRRAVVEVQAKLSEPDTNIVDERFARAAAIRNFLDYSDDKQELEIVEKIFRDEEVLKHTYCGTSKTYDFIELNSSMNNFLEEKIGDDTENLSKVNNAIKELSFWENLEAGATSIEYKLEREASDRTWTLRRKFYFNSPWTHEGGYDTEHVLEENLENIKEMQAIVEGKKLYKSSYSDSIPSLAMITHNRAKAVSVLTEFLDNFIRYGHNQREGGLPVYLFDDSNDKGRVQRESEFNKLASKYADRNLKLEYIGPKQKQQIIEDYVGIIDNKLDTNMSKREIRACVNAALACDGGPGAQRNWAQLYSSLSLDDDVHPFVKVTHTENKEFEYVPVDVISALARSINKPGVLASNLGCLGYPSPPGVREIQDYLLSPGQGSILDEQVYAMFSDRGREIYQVPNTDSNDVSGLGLINKASLTEGDIAFPANPNAKRCIRIEDQLAYNMDTNFARTRHFTGETFHQPGSFLTHDFKDMDTSVDGIENALVEYFSSPLVPSLLSRLIEDTEIDFDKQDLKTLAFNLFLGKPQRALKNLKDKEAHILELGKRLKHLVERPKVLNQYLHDVFVDSEELAYRFAEVTAMLDRMHKDSNFVHDNKQLQSQNYLKALNRLGIQAFYNEQIKKNVFDFDKFNTDALAKILRPELKRYADTLRIWPYLVKAQKIRAES